VKNQAKGVYVTPDMFSESVQLGLDMDITVLSSVSESSLPSPPQALRLPLTWPHLLGSAPFNAIGLTGAFAKNWELAALG